MIEAAPLVLLVEDDDGDALLIQECLNEVGISGGHVRWQRTLAAGRAALVDAPGCVLLDLGLPDAEGLQSLTALVATAAAARPGRGRALAARGAAQFQPARRRGQRRDRHSRLRARQRQPCPAGAVLAVPPRRA